MATLLTIHLEGTIGAGKSTAFESLKASEFGKLIHFIREPVDKWQNHEGFNYLVRIFPFFEKLH